MRRFLGKKTEAVLAGVLLVTMMGGSMWLYLYQLAESLPPVSGENAVQAAVK